MGVGKYWKSITRGSPEVGDQDKLEVFTPCLSPDLQKAVRFMQRGGEHITFQRVYALLAQRNERTTAHLHRTTWENLSLPPQGRVTLRIFRDFRINFLDSRRGVPDVGEGEARRHLMSRLPPFLVENSCERRLKKWDLPQAHIAHRSGRHSPPNQRLVRGWTHYTPVFVQGLGDSLFEVVMP